VPDGATVQVVPRVPAEFVGKARVFRAEVKLVDVAMDRALDLICKPLNARLKRHPRLRAEMLADVARQYERLIPSQFRIGPIEGTKHKGEFAIVERRLCVSWLTHDDWVAPEMREPGLSICRFTFSVHQGRLRQHWTPLANVSLHALARHEERRHDRSQAALRHDLALLADAGEDGEKVPTPGGFWLGSVITAGDNGRMIKMRSVRTWLNDAG
jgi:hypothetical protein